MALAFLYARQRRELFGRHGSMDAQLDQLGVSGYRIQRRAQLVRDDREEITLRPIRGLGDFPRVLLALEQSGAIERQCALTRQGERRGALVVGEDAWSVVGRAHDAKDAIVHDERQNRRRMVARRFEQRPERGIRRRPLFARFDEDGIARSHDVSDGDIGRNGKVAPPASDVLRQRRRLQKLHVSTVRRESRDDGAHRAQHCCCVRHDGIGDLAHRG